MHTTLNTRYSGFTNEPVSEPAQAEALQTTFNTIKGAFPGLHRSVLKRVEEGALGFWQLPDQTSALEQVREVASRLPADISDVIWIGIGGSSLGSRAVYDALAHPTSTMRRLHFLDNTDPWLWSGLQSKLSPGSTATVVVSKSGGTLETVALWNAVQAWQRKTLGPEDINQRTIAITDPERGWLRNHHANVPKLPIPPAVGGRFCVLTAVGLLAAELAGLDAECLLIGAQRAARQAEHDQLEHNPAGLMAAVHCAQHWAYGRNIHVLMPYSDRLRTFGQWHVQLWAESLGKRPRQQEKKVPALGPTPLAAVGSTDQHSQLQLFMEGPSDKVYTIVRIDQAAHDVELRRSQNQPPGLPEKISLQNLLNIQCEATTEALARTKQPCLMLRLPRLDASCLGELFFLFEAATAFAGEMYDINAFDQPGVELAKQLTKEALAST